MKKKNLSGYEVNPIKEKVEPDRFISNCTITVVQVAVRVVKPLIIITA